jgi:hypothetical protein
MNGEDVDLILTEQATAFIPPYQRLLGDAMHGIAVREFAFDRVIVVIAVPDRMVEDRRVGRQPGDRQLVDVAPEGAGPQQIACDVVEPEALAQIARI